jgi:hypothetical protein
MAVPAGKVSHEEAGPSSSRDVGSARLANAPDVALRLLQRQVGNTGIQALARRGVLPELLSRPRPPRVRLARQWSGAVAGGWNGQVTSVGGSLRIPVAGLPAGVASTDSPKETSESADHRAIVVVPDTANLSSGTVEVLLHFHGQNIGYRQRSKEGTVRDVEVDQIEQQLAASGRNIVAVLPQGTVAGLIATDPSRLKFGIGNATAYVNDALAKALPQIPSARRPAGATLTARRLVVSGHSAGGGYAAAYASDTHAAKTKAEWLGSPPLLLFDGINNAKELQLLKTILEGWLQDDLRFLSAASDPMALLSKRGTIFRSTAGAGSSAIYTQMNAQLASWLKKWFKDNAPGLSSGVVDAWRGQYLILSRKGTHDEQVGIGAQVKAKDLVEGPQGVVGKGNKVPVYHGGGNLEEALRSLDQPLEHSSKVIFDAPQDVHAVHADEKTFSFGLIKRNADFDVVKRTFRKEFTMYLPPAFAVPNLFSLMFNPASLHLKVHVFFSAGSSVNDMLVHGLRGASDRSEWITIDVPGSTLADGTSIATPFSDADLDDVLGSVGLTGPIDALRLTGHSRGAISLVHAVASKKLTHLSQIDRVVLLDEMSRGKIQSLVAAGIPRNKIVGYQVNDSSAHVKGVHNYVKLPPRGMEALGCVRMVQDQMKLNPAVAAEVAADPQLAAQVDSITLPDRGKFTTGPPTGDQVNIQDFCKEKKNADAIKVICAHNAQGFAPSSLPKSHSLLALINKHDMAQLGGFVIAPGIAAHHLFVAEIAGELYT